MPQARVYDELDQTELDQLARLLQQQRKEMDCENALLMDASRTLRR